MSEEVYCIGTVTSVHHWYLLGGARKSAKDYLFLTIIMKSRELRVEDFLYIDRAST